MKILEVLVEVNDDSKHLLAYLAKNNIKHRLVYDKELIKEAKKALKRECPIVFLYDYKNKRRQIITSLKEIKEYING